MIKLIKLSCQFIIINVASFHNNLFDNFNESNCYVRAYECGGDVMMTDWLFTSQVVINVKRIWPNVESATLFQSCFKTNNYALSCFLCIFKGIRHLSERRHFKYVGPLKAFAVSIS